MKWEGFILSLLLCMGLVVPSIFSDFNDALIRFEDAENSSQFEDSHTSLITTVQSIFQENKGQITNPLVQYYGRIPGGLIGFAESRVILYLYESDDALILTFENSRVVNPRGINETESRFNFFLGNRGTHTDVRSVRSVVFEELWSGIDLVYDNSPKGAKYEFRLSPGSNPDDIRIRISNHDEFEISRSSLSMTKNGQSFIDEGLVAFQDGKEVEVSFLEIGPDCFGFSVTDYDDSQILIIDPIVYSTYVGGLEADQSYDIAVDSSGAVYVTGATFGILFPEESSLEMTTSDYQGSSWDAFVFKLSSDGSSILWGTYMGGMEQDIGSSIAVDLVGTVYVTGNTGSSDFPLVNAYDDSLGGEFDCFVVKLSMDGGLLEYSTYLGGSDGDSGASIVVDEFGVVYVGGSTSSTDFPTINAYDATNNGSSDAFVFKLSGDGSVLEYSTFIGGGSEDYCASISVDSQRAVYMTGETRSTDFPIVNAYNDTIATYSSDVFILKLSPTGLTLEYSTFIGGGGNDNGNSIAVDSMGNAFVVGRTGSIDFPLVNAIDDEVGDERGAMMFWSEAFILGLTPAGNELIFSTYMGGSERDDATSIALDSASNLIVTGLTESQDFPNFFLPNTTSHLSNVFVLKMASDGSVVYYSEIFGGSGYDVAESIALDFQNNIYITGSTRSEDFPVLNAYDDSYNNESIYDRSDCFVMKLEAIPNPYTPPDTTQLFVVVLSISIIGIVIIVDVLRRRRQ